MEYGLNRTQRVEVRISPEEYEILDRVAGKNGVSISDYLRWMAMLGAVKSGDKGALKLLGSRVRDAMWEFWEGIGFSRKGKVL